MMQLGSVARGDNHACLYVRPTRLQSSAPAKPRRATAGCSVASSTSRHPFPCRGIASKIQPRSRLGIHSLAAVGIVGGQSATLPDISTVDEFEKTVQDHELLIVDFMARWCRKCIYLKPKLERMLREDFPGLPIMFVDVNAVPSDIIKGAGVKKMPTIQLYSQGKRVTEHVAAEAAIDALEKIKLMILRNSDLKLPPKK